MLVREAPDESSSKAGALVAFAHFRFTVQGEFIDTMAGEPMLCLWDLQIGDSAQRKGLGKHMLMILELIARRESMSLLSVPIQLNDDVSLGFIRKCKYVADMSLREVIGFDPDMEGFEVFSKSLAAPVGQNVTVKATSTSEVSTPTKAKVSTQVCSFERDRQIALNSNQTTPTYLSLTLQVSSPQGVADAVEDISQESTTESQDIDAEEEVGMHDIDEYDIINGLKAMFLEKNQREATEDECQSWLQEIRSAKLEAATGSLPLAPGMSTAPSPPVPPTEQMKINKRTYDC